MRMILIRAAVIKLYRQRGGGVQKRCIVFLCSLRRNAWELDSLVISPCYSPTFYDFISMYTISAETQPNITFDTNEILFRPKHKLMASISNTMQLGCQPIGHNKHSHVVNRVDEVTCIKP